MQQRIKFTLRQNTYIRKLFAVSLLVVFALSITPTKVLHYFFANHKDGIGSKTRVSNIPTLSVAVYHCQCDNIVVESPFTLRCQPIVAEISTLLVGNKPASEPSFHFVYRFYFELRGPPSFA